MRFSILYLLIGAFLFVIACTSYGQLGCSDPCYKTYDGTPGSCPAAGATRGEVGGECAAWPSSPCSAGARCIDTTCLACGGENQMCCDPVGTPSCTEGNCVLPGSDGDGVCKTTCGLLTAPDNSCCSGDIDCFQGMCDLDSKTCIDNAGSGSAGSPCVGPTAFDVAIVDPAGCATDHSVYSTSGSNAQLCASHDVQGFGSGWTAVVDPNIQEFDTCDKTEFAGPFFDQYYVVDTSKLTSCEQEQCPGCTIGVETPISNTCAPL